MKSKVVTKPECRRSVPCGHHLIIAVILAVFTVAACPSPTNSTNDRSSHDILFFRFPAELNDGLNFDVEAVIDGLEIRVTLPFGANRDGLLIAEFDTNGVSVFIGGEEGHEAPESGTRQESGVTPNDFTNSVEYRVTAENGGRKTYTVRIVEEIASPEQLALLGDFRDGDYVLVNDIDLSSLGSWIPIGRHMDIPFTGTFDGRGFTITGLIINSDSLDSRWGQGLFGVVRGATIENVTLADVSISGDSIFGTGALIGVIRNDRYDSTLVRNCHVTGSISSSGGSVGGLIGNASTWFAQRTNNISSITIIDSSTDCNVVGGGNVGGLLGGVNVAGDQVTLVVSGSSAHGDVEGKGSTGGLIGNVGYGYNPSISITDSHASGLVRATEGGNIGGFIGFLSSYAYTGSYREGVVVRGCSATGDVEARNSPNVGGFVGGAASIGEGALLFETSSSHGSVQGREVVGGFVGSTGLTGDGQNPRRSAYRYCYATGDVSATGVSVGGFAGELYRRDADRISTVDASYALGNVSGSGGVGGFVGSAQGRITGSYSVGRVEGGDSSGGFAGSARFGVVLNSFYDEETSGRRDSEIVLPRPTEHMKTKQTFLDAGWDFVGEDENGTEGIWNIDPTRNNGYPYLQEVPLR
ncbi:hypothetical protein [Alkalispirochaeta americana]|uniref:hypothetical protein n=1 Tax=Alkalispirochaeta americana TaxID=159291 RepID=UPI00117A3DFD|nr:hypothetical protein [Alkalispirochaeta americana]